jgi:hypothetical protein
MRGGRGRGRPAVRRAVLRSAPSRVGVVAFVFELEDIKLDKLAGFRRLGGTGDRLWGDVVAAFGDVVVTCNADMDLGLGGSDILLLLVVDSLVE